MTGQPPAPAATAGRRPRSRLVAVLLVLAGAGLIVLAAGRTWLHQPVSGVPGLRTVTASGQLAAPGVSAAALVAAAGGIALAMAGRVIRVVVAAVVLLAGVGVAALVRGVLSDPSGALAPTLVTATGQAGGGQGAGQASSTGWPWLALGAAALVMIGGALALWRGRSWAAGGRRFETVPAANRPGADGAAGADSVEADLDAWDALSRGEDPTA